MDDGESTGSNAIWAVALVIIVAMIVGAVYYSGILRSAPKKNNVEINVTAPDVREQQRESVFDDRKGAQAFRPHDHRPSSSSCRHVRFDRQVGESAVRWQKCNPPSG